MRFLTTLLASATFLPSVLSILSDEAFHIDYHQALLGNPQPQSTFFHRPQSSSSASLLYTLSDKHVLGAVNPKDGSLVWRQSLGDLQEPSSLPAFVVAAEGTGSIVSASDNVVSAWDALDGQLAWTDTATPGQQAVSLAFLPAADGTYVISAGIIVLSGPEHGKVRKLDAGSGKTLWYYDDPNGDTPILVGATPAAIYYLSKHSALLGAEKIKVMTLDPVTGQEKKQQSLSADGDISSEASKLGLVTHGAVPFVYLAEKSFKTIKISPIGTTKFTSLGIENNSGEEIESVEIHGAASAIAPAQFLVHFRTANKGWAEVYHIDPKSLAISKAYSLPILQGPDAFSTAAIDASTYLTRTTSSEILLYSLASHGILGRWARTGDVDSTPQHAAAEVVPRPNTSFAVRVAQTAVSGEWSLIRNGETAWSRPEMLAGITAAAWSEVDGSDELAGQLEVEGHQNPLAAYLHRLKRHVADLSGLPMWLASLPKTITSAFLPSDADPKDSFFKGKVLIVATRDAQVLCLDPNNRSSILWRYQAFDRQSSFMVKGITIHNGKATVFLDRAGSLTLDIKTGALINSNKSGFEIQAVAEVFTDSGDVVVKTSHSGIPYNFDETHNEALEGSYLVTVSDSGEAKGWALGSMSEPLWIFKAAPGSRITKATARPAHDPVASIGRVLGDRSVLYKYLSSNLVLLTSTSSTALTMYLIEAVSGAVLFTTTHAGVDSTMPVATIFSENWLAYSFYGNAGDTTTKAFQIVVHELYESSVPNDRGPLGSSTNHSMFDLGTIVPPHVTSQSFIIPEMVGEMAITQTSQGITTRQLICTLPETSSIIGIPRQFLDPRRVVDRDPTSNEQEEGLFRYMPVLEFDPKWVLTHSRDVVGVKAVITTPTMLESTSLVFAYGHDLFGTKLNPSMAFDILGKGFNKPQLLLTVIALGVGVGFLAPMVRKRQVDARWKM